MAVVDFEARNMAALAKQRIETHEKTCEERWAHANQRLERIYLLIIGGQGSLILMVATGLLALFLKG